MHELTKRHVVMRISVNYSINIDTYISISLSHMKSLRSYQRLELIH